MKTLAAGTVKRVHVDRLIMNQNRKNGTNHPAYTIQTSKGSIKAHVVEAFLRFDQKQKPLPCGARMYGETRGEVRYE